MPNLEFAAHGVAYLHRATLGLNLRPNNQRSLKNGGCLFLECPLETQLSPRVILNQQFRLNLNYIIIFLMLRYSEQIHTCLYLYSIFKLFFNTK